MATMAKKPVKKTPKAQAPMTPLQERDWVASVKQVDKKSHKSSVDKKAPMSVTKTKNGDKYSKKAIKSYNGIITKKLNKDDTHGKK